MRALSESVEFHTADLASTKTVTKMRAQKNLEGFSHNWCLKIPFPFLPREGIQGGAREFRARPNAGEQWNWDERETLSFQIQCRFAAANQQSADRVPPR